MDGDILLNCCDSVSTPSFVFLLKDKVLLRSLGSFYRLKCSGNYVYHFLSIHKHSVCVCLCGPCNKHWHPYTAL